MEVKNNAPNRCKGKLLSWRVDFNIEPQRRDGKSGKERRGGGGQRRVAPGEGGRPRERRYALKGWPPQG